MVVSTIVVPQQLLHGPDVVTILQQMSGKGMTKRVARRRSVQTKRGTPSKQASTASTSSRVSTTGSRFGLRARTTPSIRSSRLYQHMFVKKQQRCQSLVLRGRGHVFFDRQVGQEAVHVAFGQLARMRAGVKQDEAANPVDVSLLGAVAVMPGAQGFYHTVVEPRRRLTRK